MTALFTRASLIVLSAAALAACADMKPEYAPTSAAGPTAPPAAQPAPEPETPVGADAAPRAVPTTPVVGESLPPVNRRPGDAADTDDIEAAPASAQTTPPRPEPSQAYAPPPVATRPAPVIRAARRPPPPAPTFILSVKGPVRAAKEKTHTVKVAEGDTVNNLSERFHTPKADVIKLNKLKKPYELEVGRSLKIPTPKAYVVESGDTLFAISKRFNLSAEQLAELNNLDPNEKVRSGEEIDLPIDVKDSGPLKRPGPPAPRRGEEETIPSQEQPTYRPPEPTYRPQPPIRPEPPSRYSPPPVTPLVESSPAPSDAQVTAAGQGHFVWPVDGQLLSRFGSKPGGQRNDGVDIGAPSGTVVKAAAAGDVVYAGNQVPGFGNLVLIKHAGGWVTAYAHLSVTSVKIKDHVEQGDQVGQVGQTGGADVPELHFEIRYAPTPRDKAKPIDPTLVLPSG
jgi:murein DD-endopeptidase MepM/ murein hydrolase activator NlpD